MRPYLLLVIAAIILINSSCKKLSFSGNTKHYRLTDSSYTYNWKGTSYTDMATISRTVSVKINNDNSVVVDGNTYQDESDGHYRHFAASIQSDLWLTESTISFYIIGPASPGSAYYGISMRGVRE